MIARTMRVKDLAEAVREEIKSAKLPPGAALLSAKELAERHGVSALTAHRALKTLVDAGVVYGVRGSGTFVAGKRAPSRFIGVAMSSEANGAFHMRLLMGIQQEARRRNVIPLQHIASPRKPSPVFEEEVAGWISVAEPLDDITALVQGKPVVYLHNRDIRGRSDCVLEDCQDGLRQAIQRLHALGHRRFAYFDVRPWGGHQAERYGAFHQILSEFDLPAPPPEWVVTPTRKDRSIADVEQKLRTFLAAWLQMAERPSALLTAADVYGLALLRVAPEFGVSIPRDLSVVGYDDEPACELSTPTLASIAQPMEEMGVEAMRRLLDKIEAPDMEPKTIRVGMKYIERASVGPAQDTPHVAHVAKERQNDVV